MTTLDAPHQYDETSFTLPAEAAHRWRAVGPELTDEQAFVYGSDLAGELGIDALRGLEVEAVYCERCGQPWSGELAAVGCAGPPASYENGQPAYVIEQLHGYGNRAAAREQRRVYLGPHDPRIESPVPVVNARAGKSPSTPRNAPCPCGSGKKYKRCCGLSDLSHMRGRR